MLLQKAPILSQSSVSPDCTPSNSTHHNDDLGVNSHHKDFLEKMCRDIRAEIGEVTGERAKRASFEEDENTSHY